MSQQPNRQQGRGQPIQPQYGQNPQQMYVAQGLTAAPQFAGGVPQAAGAGRGAGPPPAKPPGTVPAGAQQLPGGMQQPQQRVYTGTQVGPAAGVAQQRAAPGSAPAGLSRPAQAAAQAAQQQRAPMSPEQYERYLRGVKELTSSHLFDVALLPMKRKGLEVKPEHKEQLERCVYTVAEDFAEEIVKGAREIALHAKKSQVTKEDVLAYLDHFWDLRPVAGPGHVTKFEPRDREAGAPDKVAALKRAAVAATAAAAKAAAAEARQQD